MTYFAKVNLTPDVVKANDLISIINLIHVVDVSANLLLVWFPCDLANNYRRSLASVMHIYFKTQNNPAISNINFALWYTLLKMFANNTIARVVTPKHLVPSAVMDFPVF